MAISVISNLRDIVISCESSVAVGDLVSLLSTETKVFTITNNQSLLPILGLVTSLPTAGKARVLIEGDINYSPTLGIGLLYVSSSGDITIVPPVQGYIQNLGMSLGNGTIIFNSNFERYYIS